MSLGTNLRKLRSRTKYSQQDIADILDVDRVTYAKWENETTDIKSQYIPKLAEIFGVSIQELFIDESKPNVVNNDLANKENSTSSNNIQQGVFIKIKDTEIAKLLAVQLKKLVKNLKNQ